MKVFKFGGASVNGVDRIKMVANILTANKDEKLLIVLSAMGETTNALEKVAEAFYAGNKEEALQLFEVIKQFHLTTLQHLVMNVKSATDNLINFFTEVEWLLHDDPVRNYDYYYDQIVPTGELLSTWIVSAFLNEAGIENTWIDVRDIVRTDDNFREANIDMEFTCKKMEEIIPPLFSSTAIIITQGFIGSTDENESTTLGREGSDYSAAVFANLLNAKDVTIWKDVPGVMNADPKAFSNAEVIHALSFTEVIEMAFYGAQVIHPKTIKPLQNKNIPLRVKCFLQPDLAGTLITHQAVHQLPPIIVFKQNQVLVEFNSKDFSFVGEKPVSRLYEIFADIKVKPNLTQNTAISLLCCLDNIPDKIERLALAASGIFDVQVEKNLTLLTIRHYKKELVAELTDGKNIVLEQKTKDTLQVMMRV
ncbi:MAG TPA: aspartate kinase [Chitinophagaceae bacterium]|nr:aspartate kinase [Chitinophagaceae bacterium]